MHTSHNTVRCLLAGAFLIGCAAKPLPATPDVDLRQFVADEPGQLHFNPAACAGVDLTPDGTKRDETALVNFLKSQHLDATLTRERTDLVYVDVRAGGPAVRLRVALLPTADAAGEELHRGALQHGSGAWGVHRSNLAVLAPAGRQDDILAFAVRTKLACWGVLTIVDGGEAKVIPGGYREL